MKAVSRLSLPPSSRRPHPAMAGFPHHAGSWLGIRVCLALALALAAPVSGLSTGTVGVARRAAVHRAVRCATSCSAQEVPSSLLKACERHSARARSPRTAPWALGCSARSGRELEPLISQTHSHCQRTPRRSHFLSAPRSHTPRSHSLASQHPGGDH